jgi:hypothetical protein
MDGNGNPPRIKRQYPPFYEKIVPAAIGILAFIIIVMLVIILIVALGIYPGAG